MIFVSIVCCQSREAPDEPRAMPAVLEKKTLREMTLAIMTVNKWVTYITSKRKALIGISEILNKIGIFYWVKKIG
jgi:hypothetical protein